MSFDASSVTGPLEGFRFPPKRASVLGTPASGAWSDSEKVEGLQQMVGVLAKSVVTLAREIERMDRDLTRVQR